LLLARRSGKHPLLDDLPRSAATQSAAILRRPAVMLPEEHPALRRHYRRLSLKDIDLGFAGRYERSKPVHAAIATLQPGDPLLLKHNGRAWELTNLEGRTVGRLARAFAPPAQGRFISGSVMAVLVRHRDDTEAEYQSYLQADTWELIVPELV